MSDWGWFRTAYFRACKIADLGWSSLGPRYVIVLRPTPYRLHRCAIHPGVGYPVIGHILRELDKTGYLLRPATRLCMSRSLVHLTLESLVIIKRWRLLLLSLFSLVSSLLHLLRIRLPVGLGQVNWLPASAGSALLHKTVSPPSVMSVATVWSATTEIALAELE